jgi:hypothetical protein
MNRGTDNGIRFAIITVEANMALILRVAFERNIRLYATKSNTANIKAKSMVIYFSILIDKLSGRLLQK